MDANDGRIFSQGRNTAIEQDQHISSRRQAKSAPTTPRKPRRVPISQPPLENIPDLKASLERLKAKKLSDQNLKTATSTSTIRGHQFTVGNFSNGLIYLRPVARPAHERNIALHPSTPPLSAEETTQKAWPDEPRFLHSQRDNRNRPTSPPRTPPRQRVRSEDSDTFMNSSPPILTRSNHPRAYSLSTVTGRSTPTTAPDLESYRVVIDRVETQRPKTAGPDPSVDGLHVRIPHYTLGSPWISPHGTPFLQGSSNTPVPSTRGELGSATNSQITDFKWFLPGEERSMLASCPIPLLPDRENSPFASPPPSMPSPVRHIPSPTAITPRIFDSLSFPPHSEDPAVVKYDPRNHQIIAATPPRIIAQITSATFLDYQLLSDFFLTYRLFMTPSDLVAYLIARLQWALDRTDDVGRVVRVRTFVAIRHWLLNYFGDDFVPSLSLRQKFVTALNGLSNSVLAGDSQIDTKIIGELKKCWRRTCALYWDGDHAQSSAMPDADIDRDILPGGPPGTRTDADKAGISFSLSSSPLRLFTPDLPPKLSRTATSETSGGMGSLLKQLGNDKLQRKRSVGKKGQRVITKAASDASIHASAQNYSKPLKKTGIGGLKFPPGGLSIPKSSSKLAPSGINLHAGAKGTGVMTPHKRSGSFSDALRDNRQPLPLQNSLARSTHLLMAFPYPGASLVRGTLLPPTAATVEVIAPSTPEPDADFYGSNGMMTAITSSSSVPDNYEPVSQPQHRHGISGPGMKRFMVSLKKVLGKAPPNIYGVPAMHSPVPVPRHGPRSSGSFSGSDSLTRYVAANYVNNGSSSDIRNRGGGMSGSAREGGAARIDLLGAGVVDAFHRVLQEEGRSEESRKEIPLSPKENILPRSRTITRRATVDTTTIGGSAFSEYDDKSLMENFPLSPQTRRRGNTLKESSSNGPGIYKLNEGYVQPGPTTRIQESSLGNVTIEDFGFIKVQSPRSLELRGPSSHNSIESQATEIAAERPDFVEGPIPNGRLAHSLCSAMGPASKRYSDTSYSSKLDTSSDTSSNSGTADKEATTAPNRLLRRRPGGDLRAATTVTDLAVPQRSQSTGSYTTISHSTSGYSLGDPRNRSVDDVRAGSSYHPHQLAAGVVSLGAVTGGGGVLPENNLFEEERPETPTTAKERFEQGVLKLAALTDSESDDGGIEVALMKLEGRYGRRTSKPPPSISGAADEPLSPSEVQPSDGLHTRSSIVDSHDSVDSYHHLRTKRRHKQVLDQVPLETPPELNSTGTSYALTLGVNDPSRRTVTIDQPRSSVRKGNKDSGQFPPRKSSIAYARGSNLSGFSTPKHNRDENFRVKRQTDLTESLEDAYETTDRMSDLSSEVSFEMVSRSESLNNTSFRFPRPTVIAELGISSHPLRHAPSPSLTLEQALALGPDGGDGFFQSLHGPSDHAWTSIHDVQSTESTPRKHKALRESISLLQSPSIHLPFILAYDSQLLAKQFTLIEKDALSEIDWKELVELRWKQTSASVRDWVEFLKSKDVRGVEVVIARFNLMWKWAMSEIVMTKDLDERARTVIKLIHIAAHARKFQNYATMYQITAALLTANIARLRQTWKLVSSADMATFRELEALIQPVRNFHHLRTEMDKVTGETGCIPFVGLFTHDLIYNAQRPSHLTGARDGELLVNFEKHRMTASIIKRLLRLTEASHKYDFKAVDGVCERCLWIASLSDDEIKALSKNLES